MSQKRGHGEGTVQEIKPGVWVARFSYKDPKTGTIKRKKSTGSSRREALAKGREWLKNLDDGLLPDADKITVGKWLDRWLEDFVRPSVRVKTYEKYLSTMKNYVKPKLEDVPLLKISAPDVQRLFNELLTTGGKEGKGISSLTVRNTRRYFIAALDSAVKMGLLIKNVVRLTEPPKAYKEEVRPLDREQAAQLLNAAKEVGGDVYIATYIALSTGMRIGEVMGLKWEDIFHDQKIITVRRSRVNTNHGIRIEETKTGVGRKIPVHDALLEALRFHEKRQEWQKEQLGDKWIEEGWIIAGQFGTNYDPAYFTSRKWKPLLAKAKLPDSISFHDLRHTHATLLLLAGVNPKIVQERLGHANIQMTLDTYSHLLPDTQEVAVKAIQKLFG